MKTKAEMVRGWVRKGESDLVTTKICLAAGQAYDTACFHAQQAAEKFLKAFLVAFDIDFPLIHNVEKLIDLCARQDPAFLTLKALGQSLTPYAVELRYDADFWPDRNTVEESLRAAQTIQAFVLAKLSPDTRSGGA